MRHEDFHDLLESQEHSSALFFGDWHCDLTYALSSLERAYEKFPHISVYYHVGDFGVWPGADFYLDEVSASVKAAGKVLVVTGGNHEDWDRWDKWVENGTPYNYQDSGLIFLPKLYTWKQKDVSYMSLGGASSIDQPMRHEGVSWWPQEVISRQDVDKVLQMESPDVDILITHEASNDPVRPVRDVLSNPLKQVMWQQYCIEESEEQRKMISEVVDHVKPSRHIHGHWHLPCQEYRDGLLTVSL